MQKKPYIMTCPGICRAAGTGFGLLMAFLFGLGLAADDLKQIKGVGPKLEGQLHKSGVFHFDQVASWRKKEVDWADNNLEGVKGRVSRDEWVKQAKVLAKGGETEFSKKVKKGGVY